MTFKTWLVCIKKWVEIMLLKISDIQLQIKIVFGMGNLLITYLKAKLFHPHITNL